MRMTREFYRPSGRTAIVSESPASEHYVWEEAGGLYAMGFGGKRSKPDFYYRFQSEERRTSHVANWLRNLKTRVAETKARRAERSKPHTLKIGDILDTCWGYDQTNRDFYEVIELRGKCMVVIREIYATLDHHDGGCTDYIVPDPGNYKGKPMLKRASSDNRIRIASYASASPWSGKPVGQTDAYSGH